ALSRTEKKAIKVYIAIEESKKEELKREKKEKLVKKKKINLPMHEETPVDPIATPTK
ncbi:9980_t:CDS:2, partial [Dentiscutata heterogama]